MEKRAGGKCSICETITFGPTDSPNGKAKKIVPGLRSLKNYIWLCTNCYDVVDKNQTFYTVDVLKSIKSIAEDKASEEILRFDKVCHCNTKLLILFDNVNFRSGVWT